MAIDHGNGPQNITRRTVINASVEISRGIEYGSTGIEKKLGLKHIIRGSRCIIMLVVAGELVTIDQVDNVGLFAPANHFMGRRTRLVRQEHDSA